ncbi:hypothetical protein XOO3572 [Xanthomonas oryzae pv. oryzae KACC 10331]|uniref:Uncharacterized protein n=1 Tax=Xanthomonas oryzae pv. oryzae (strain KACC10331 / KXO85) TaxID=291331 RepID=Q5GWU5_XANOR|nr:hypothetical protein XOO3572 [Xanthomonas oryzae pv. oryzae KACC 10331]
MDRRFTLDHAAGNACLRVRLGVALDEVGVGDDHAIAVHTHHFTLLTLVLAGVDDDLVAFLDTVSHVYVLRSQHFGSERDDLHELLGTQLARHRPEDAGTDRLLLVVQQHSGIAVEADQRTVGTAHTLAGTHHDGVVDFALLDLATRNGVLDGDLDDVANACITALGAAQHLDAHHFLGTRIVGDIEVALHLDHDSDLPYSAERVTISTTRQFLVLDIGAISVTRTTSPSLQALSASCACSLVERLMYLPYRACLTWRSTNTVTVLSILLLTTRPSTVRSVCFSLLSLIAAVLTWCCRAGA